MVSLMWSRRKEEKCHHISCNYFNTLPSDISTLVQLILRRSMTVVAKYDFLFPSC